MSWNGKNKAYLEYLKNHPEILAGEPPHASSQMFWSKMLAEGRCTGEEMDRAVTAARERWEQFHLEKARSLGFEISIKQLHLDKIWLFGTTHQLFEKEGTVADSDQLV